MWIRSALGGNQLIFSGRRQSGYNLLLYLTTTHVFEKFGEAQLPAWTPWLRACVQLPQGWNHPLQYHQRNACIKKKQPLEIITTGILAKCKDSKGFHVRIASRAGISRSGSGFGFNFVKMFRVDFGPACKILSQRWTLLSPVTGEAIDLIKFSIKIINCEWFTHVYFTTSPIPLPPLRISWLTQ